MPGGCGADRVSSARDGRPRGAAGPSGPDGTPDPGGTSAGLPREVRLALVAVVIARLGINGGIRVVFPFLPAIARGLGTTLAVMGVLVAVRSLVGTMAPLAASLGERTGRRAVMLGGLAATAIGSAVIGLAPSVVVAAVGFVLVGLGKPLFDVPMQGWFGARVPYAKRGRVLGITELTWAGGLLATVPLSGWLISRTTWRIQFLPVIVLVVAGLLAVAVLMRNDRPPSRVRTTLALTRPRVAMLAVVGLFSFAAESLFVVYGAWLEADLGFDVGAIGAFTVLVVAAELTGEGGVAALGDRIGLHRAVRAALVVSTVAYLTLLTVGNSVPLAILAVVIWFVGYEVSIVASVPLVTELGGEGRDRLLGLMVGVLAGGRAVGALVAPQLFALGGIGAMAVVSAVSVAIAAVLMATLVPVPRRWVG